MREAMAVLILVAVLGIVFAGTIDGRFVFECTEPSTAQGFAAVLTENAMRSLAGGSIDYTDVDFAMVSEPPWSFSIPGEFDDDSLYYAFGVAIVNDAVLEGNPIGMYPLSPFNTSGGNYVGVEIPMADTVDISIIIHPGDVEFTDIYALVLDMSQGMFSGTGEMDTDFVVPIYDTAAIIDNVPSGLKQILIFKDENSNAMYDDGEPYGYCQSIDTSFVFAAAGVPMIPEATLRIDKIDEKRVITPQIAMNLYPSPFNSELAIEIDAPAGEYKLKISDISGKIVHSGNVCGGTSYKWSPENLSSGIYNVKISGQNFVIQKNAVYLK
ncbi:T9SS type A sorting domain-containing protein [bacterium]|nr:T9SS type A sorting domain-containing protein [bacterium]